MAKSVLTESNSISGIKQITLNAVIIENISRNQQCLHMHTITTICMLMFYVFIGSPLLAQSTQIIKGSFLFEREVIGHFDSYMRYEAVVKDRKDIYRDTIFFFQNDIVTLFDYGYEGGFEINEALEDKKQYLGKTENIHIIDCFKYCRFSATISCYYLGTYKIPIPSYCISKTTIHNHRMKEMKVFIITDVDSVKLY